jgi:DNA-binding FrmR family transcriptional regulator
MNKRGAAHPSHAGQLTRLRRIEGQVRGVATMVQQGRYCVDILTQTRAIQAALRKVEEEILSTHVTSCVVDAARSGKQADQNARLAELMDVISRFGR